MRILRSVRLMPRNQGIHNRSTRMRGRTPNPSITRARARHTLLRAAERGRGGTSSRQNGRIAPGGTRWRGGRGDR